ncbi:hypothetical protein DV735_g1418, partial [Chaetothyriales sp. CBS 134920]
MEYSPISVGSNDSGYVSNFGWGCDLPSSSYDGSHLHWKSFRQHVLEPHRIRIADSTPRDTLPDSFLALVEAGVKDVSRFESQAAAFREQVASGRAFGPSPLFPPNAIPPSNKAQGLAQCMLPAFSREPLPPRVTQHGGPLYELSVPRSSLGCGFSASALTGEELQRVPAFMVPTGTDINYDTGHITPDTPIYSPFLTFTRSFGVKELFLEAANNQCAIAGTWCLRAMHLLQTAAFPREIPGPSPLAFSCVIDNTFAIINLHWLDERQYYCMSPLCKFDLSNPDHFLKFLVWIEAIGQWAMQNLLPLIKNALQKLFVREPSPVNMPPTPEEFPIFLRLNTNPSPAEVILQSVRTTFDNVPWQIDSAECTPISSSTASWGSPATNDIHFTYPIHSGTAAAAYTQRIASALEEIRDLSQQLHILKRNFHNATNSTQSELGAVKTTLASVLCKQSGTSGGVGLNLVGSTEVWHKAGAVYTVPHTPAAAASLEGLKLPPSRPLPLKLMKPDSNSECEGSSVTSLGRSLPSSSNTAGTENEIPTPLPTSRRVTPPTPYTPYTLVPPPPPPEHSSRSLFKWSAMTLSAHMVASLIPVMSLRIIVLGMITEAAWLSFSSPHYGVSWEWIMRDLLRRLSPTSIPEHLNSLTTLVPDLTEDLLSSVDQPLQTARCGKTARDYLLCDYNRDGDSYRSPWSNEFYPALPAAAAEDAPYPSDRVRRLEVEANYAFDVYRQMYYEGGVGSVYLWDLTDGFAGVVLLKKQVGANDAADVSASASPSAGHYKLTSTVILHLARSPSGAKDDSMTLAGSMTRQVEADLVLVEDMEGKMRNMLQEVYFGKAKDVVGDVRSIQPLSGVNRDRDTQREVMQSMNAR